MTVIGDNSNPGLALDSTLRKFSGYNLKRAYIAVQSDLLRTLEPYGLRMISFSVLVLIADNPGIRQSTISETLCVERPNLVVVIDELENRALITRNPVPADRRAYALKVTLAGRQLCDKAVAAADRHENEMTQGTGRDEREALIEILNKIERNLLSRQSSSGQRRRQT